MKWQKEREFMASDDTNDGGFGQTPGWNDADGASNLGDSSTPPPPPREGSPLGFAATPTEPPPSSWNTQTPGSAGSQPAAAPLTMSDPAPVPPPLSPSSAMSSKLPWIVAVVAAVVLLGGGAFFAASVFGAAGGAESPEAAADGLLAALENEDFVTAAELLEPAERRTIAEPMLTEVLPELVRLGALDESTEADNVEDFDLNLTDTEVRVEAVPGADDLRYVYLSGGELDVDGDTQALPTDSETPIVIVERDGRWYYSLWFTIAENARFETDERIPLESEAPAAIPSDSPEGAVEGMMTAVSNLDLRAMIGHMDPEEMAALYRYSPLFLDEAQQALDDAQGDLTSEGFSWELSNFDFDVDESGDDAIVSMRGFTLDVDSPDFEMALDYQRENLTGAFIFEGGTISVDATTTVWTVDGSLDGDPVNVDVLIDPESLRVSGTAMFGQESAQGELTLDRDGVCSEYSLSSSDGDNESGCLEEDGESDYVVGPLIEAMEEWPSEFPGIDIAVHNTDGGWYVSPMGTIFDGIVAGLEDIEEEDFDGLFDDFSDGVSSGIVDDVADSFIGIDDGGEFTEPVITDPVLSEPEVEDFTVLNYDSSRPLTVAGSISLNTFDVYEFTVDEGISTLVTINRSDGSSLDSLLTIRDSDGFEVASNDDALANLANSLDSQAAFVPERAGVYTIEVASWANGTEGAYELTIESGEVVIDSGEPEGDDDLVDVAEPDVDEPPVDEPPVQQELVQVVVGSGEQVVIDGYTAGSGGLAAYEVDLAEGDFLVITVESVDPAELDPVVSLVFADIEVGRNDDAPDSSLVADSFDSRLEVVAFDDGPHEIVVDAYTGDGNFVMTIERNVG